MHRTYVGRLERGESGVTVEALAALLAVEAVAQLCRLTDSVGNGLPPVAAVGEVFD